MALFVSPLLNVTVPDPGEISKPTTPTPSTLRNYGKISQLFKAVKPNISYKSLLSEIPVQFATYSSLFQQRWQPIKSQARASLASPANNTFDVVLMNNQSKLKSNYAAKVIEIKTGHT